MLPCAVLVSLVKAQNSCVGRPDGTHVNDFTACDGFFTCVRGMAVQGRCPAGFYFHEEKQKCDFPWNVVCLLCVDTDDGGGEGSGYEPGPGQNPDGPMSFPIQGECQRYTLCINGRGFLQECGIGLQFNPVARICDLEENVRCVPKICSNHINPNVATFVPHPQDCAKYYVCLFGDVVGDGPQRCAGDLLFNPATGWCDLPQNVDCGNKTPPPPIAECRPDGVHYIPSMDSCSKHYICFQGTKIGPVQCAAGLIFDIVTMTCQIESDRTECILDGGSMLVDQFVF
ncbi:hypothetical protein pipiens_005542 [Culex pipiens pipiens]|uniref:Chitin-binding type-2 domain-containing protein n=1 Tax=Culex pipiens pipiens TaxID=38569 RepID=A0ABD1DVV8_CULPP